MTRRKAPSPAADLHRAVDLFYQAAADPAAWGEAFAAAARALAAPASCATWIDGAGPDGAWFRHHGFDPEVVDSYLAEFIRLDPWLIAGQDPAWVEGRVVDGAELVDPARLRGTRFGEEFLPRVGVTRLLTGFAVRQGARMASLSFFRPESGPAFGEAERRAWGLLQPHFRRAVWLQERLALADAQAAALDRLPHGLLLLDGGGRVLFANRAADAMLAAEDGLSRREGRLAANGRPPAPVDGLVAAAAASPDPARPGSAGGALAVPRPSGKPPWLLVASPLPPDLASGLPAGARARVLLVLSDPARRPAPSADHLRRLFRLTAQEARLVLLLCEGLELKEAAERLGVAYATARAHLRAAVAKAGVRRQTQLVALTLALLAPRPEDG